VATVTGSRQQHQGQCENGTASQTPDQGFHGIKTNIAV
jgi:hypothetical protein